jgi:hypothetical protein
MLSKYGSMGHSIYSSIRTQAPADLRLELLPPPYTVTYLASAYYYIPADFGLELLPPAVPQLVRHAYYKPTSVSIRQHPSASVSLRQHPSAFVTYVTYVSILVRDADYKPVLSL